MDTLAEREPVRAMRKFILEPDPQPKHSIQRNHRLYPFGLFRKLNKYVLYVTFLTIPGHVLSSIRHLIQ